MKEVHGDVKKNSLIDDDLKRKLEDLFKFEYDNQEVEKRLIESRIRTIQTPLSKSDNKIKQSLAEDLSKLNETKTSDKVNDFIKKMYLEMKQHKVQELLQKQKEGILHLCKILKKYESDLADTIEAFHKQDQEQKESTLEQTLQTLEDQNERLQAKLNDGKEGHPNTESIKALLKRNGRILETLEQLELSKEGLLINAETKNNYREELESREKIKFAIIEDKLLEVLKEETFNEAKIKELLEKAELEYYLAEKCIKYPVIKTKDNIKYFCQGLLSPLINRLVENIINYVPKDNESSEWNPINLYKRARIAINYNMVGWSATNNSSSTEGKVLKVAHNTYKEVETFLQYFESSYEEVGGLVGDVFSDDGKTFKKDIWPKIQDHLRGMWGRFFKDIEFSIDKDTSQKPEEEVQTKLDGSTTQKHDLLVNSAQVA